MSLLTYTELLELVDNGTLKNSDPDLVNAASIDIRMGESMLKESDIVRDGRDVDLANKESPWMMMAKKFGIRDDVYWVLYPGEFALVHSMEVFNLPDWLACEYKLKSSLARAGLDHALAGWADPGFHDASLTLEIKNNLQRHNLILRPGMKIGQMVFWRGESVPADASYAVRGRYNGQSEPTTSKGVE
jgi:dCTP deaminase